ncbi:hypothetical protein ACFVP0_27710 [Streptomyces cinereoruber]|uniref:hypothetical protein n=1 Tax=Streptomyces cinereoruber TaxID=67260 RepID=UPI0036B71B00
MNASTLLPGDPSELRLCISYTDDLGDTSRADTLERWDVTILHEEAEVGAMTFYKVHLDRSMCAFRAMEEESEDLYETAQALLDPATGSFTEDVGGWLPYAGSALLVMDRVTLTERWRGHGLGAILATEAIYRLMAGCRAVACSPGVTDLSSDRLRNQAEWDRVNAKIARGWERVGFSPYQETVYLLSPASEELEEQRGAMRGRLAELGASWRLANARCASS